MVKIWLFHCRGTDSVPGQRTEIPQAEQPKKIIRILTATKNHMNAVCCVPTSKNPQIHW